ncbi:uroporphyrinogen-III synthase [Sphingobium sp. AN641]|uniref:uroporphyrinogen-III synthase n=1 Tax=Sphingobium sp. AN641 TaxID=3133443 RepID=UPI0030C237FE
MSRLLVVRPQPGAAATAARAAAIGLECACYPLFAVAPLDWMPSPPQDHDALLLTSAHGVTQAGDALARYHGLPSYAVGARTAAALEAAGFGNVVAGDSDGAAILRRIAMDGHRRLLHIAGADSAPFDAGSLSITRVAVYAAREAGDAAGLAALVAPGMVALVHSPRAGQRLAALLPEAVRASLHLVAISPAALRAASHGWASAVAASRPDDDAMLALAARLCK